MSDHGETDATIRADVEVLGGNPDETDLAAVTSVLAGVLDELAAEQGRLEQAAAPSAWEPPRP